MARKQCVFLSKGQEAGHFSETLTGISTLTKWIPEENFQLFSIQKKGIAPSNSDLPPIRVLKTQHYIWLLKLTQAYIS